MPSPTSRATAGLLAASLAAAALVMAGQDRGLQGIAVVLALAALAAWRPHAAVLVMAGLAPLGAALGFATGVLLPWAEILMLAPTAGWLARRSAGRDGNGSTAFEVWSLAFGLSACASALAMVWAASWAVIPDRFGPAAWLTALASELDSWASPLRQALRLAAGAGAATYLARSMREAGAARRGARMLVIASCGIAMFSVYRVFEIALRTETPWSRAWEVVASLRIAPVIGDPNALGALFLLTTPMAFALALERSQRFFALVAVVVLVAGAWLAGSRTTLALTPCALAAVLLLRHGVARLRMVAAAAVLMAVIPLGLLLLPSARHVSASTAWTVRRDLAVVTGRMLRDEPLFGVGLGQYYDRSTEYMPASLRGYYRRENAHNQYFQIAGELGVMGLAPFLVMLGLAVAPAVARSASLPDAAGLAAGAIAFLAASLAQHPLLDPHISAAFWIVIGLLCARGGHGPDAVERRLWQGGVVLSLAVVALLPLQAVHRARTSDLSGRVVGARLARDSGQAEAFWTTRRAATMYLPAGTRSCDIVVRARGTRGDTGVSLRLNQRPAGGVSVARGEWRRFALTMPARAPWPLPHHRLDLEWTDRPAGRVALDLRAPRCQ